jgi:chromate transport protein ChrA
MLIYQTLILSMIVRICLQVCVESPDSWVTVSQFKAGLAIIQAMPGPMFNLSAYLGAVIAIRCALWLLLSTLSIYLHVSGTVTGDSLFCEEQGWQSALLGKSSYRYKRLAIIQAMPGPMFNLSAYLGAVIAIRCALFGCRVGMVQIDI